MHAAARSRVFLLRSTGKSPRTGRQESALPIQGSWRAPLALRRASGPWTC